MYGHSSPRFRDVSITRVVFATMSAPRWGLCPSKNVSAEAAETRERFCLALSLQCELTVRGRSFIGFAQSGARHRKRCVALVRVVRQKAVINAEHEEPSKGDHASTL